jgi:nucleotide-binding universal stress UspA family protein
MLKRILILLGETKSSASARHYAFRLAHSTQASVAGLAGIDLTYLNSPMLGGIGTTAWEIGTEKQFKTQADKARRRLHEVYESECSDHRLAFEWLSFDGDPIETLRMASETRDLVVTGKDTGFRGDVDKQSSEMLSKLLAMTPRPVVICPDELSSSDDFLIAYDGSMPAMRALQMFALLGIGRKNRIHVTSVDASQELAARRTGGAIAYLHSHAYEAEAHPIASSVYPAEVLNIEIVDRKIGTLVMGAYGHRGFREFLLGSTTSTLVESPPCALFVYS